MKSFNPDPKTIEDLEKMTKDQLSVFAKNSFDGWSIRNSKKRESIRKVAIIRGIEIKGSMYEKEWWML